MRKGQARTVELKRVAEFLDRELKVEEFKDSSNNGLQVANAGKVTKICCGVDASLEFFEVARKRGADLLVCHHGISWGDSLKRITDLNYKRVSYLINNGMALYGVHLPLDAHPKYGNNIGICKVLGLRNLKPFGLYSGIHIGLEGRLPEPMRYESFKKLVRRKINDRIQTFDYGKKTVQTVGVISGGAAGEVDEAGRKDLDVYVSGESLLFTYHIVREYGLNAIFAGHYATETFGVKSLAGLLKRRFSVDTEFIDLKVPY